MSLGNNSSNAIVFSGEKKLPNNLCLYQPCEDRQIVLAENASCLAVKTYLQIFEIPFVVYHCDNAEFMPSEGRLTHLPLLRSENRVAAEFGPIINLLDDLMGISAGLKEEEVIFTDDIKALITFVDNEFTLAELFVSFKIKENYKKHFNTRYGSSLPWLLKSLLKYKKNVQVKNLLKAYEWHDFTRDEMIERFTQCCDMLNGKLAGKNANDMHFYANKLGYALDACVYGHLMAILSTKLSDNILDEIIRQHLNLLKFCEFIEEKYWSKERLS